MLSRGSIDVVKNIQKHLFDHHQKKLYGSIHTQIQLKRKKKKRKEN